MRWELQIRSGDENAVSIRSCGRVRYDSGMKEGKDGRIVDF
jgi:hypothetical protein